MYFDWDYWWRVTRHVWRLQGHPKRWQLLLRLMLAPLAGVFHSLCMALDYVFFPALWHQQVVAPVFVIGHARSGTTLMHRLLSGDQQRFSYFHYWEMFFPSLIQRKCIAGVGWLDQRLLGGALYRRLQAWDEKRFGRFRHMHDMSLWNAEEDAFVMQAAFVTQQWSLDIPLMHEVDIFHLDLMPEKRRRWLGFYRACVKRQLLLNGGDKTHLSKNPLMCGWVESLIREFPDARFVVLVRNPAQCIPSALQLVKLTWQGKGWSEADYGASLQALMAVSFDSFHHPRQVLQRYRDSLYTEVDYRQLVADPQQAVQQVYTALELPLGAEYAAWLAGRAEREKSHSVKFDYSLDNFDLTLATIEQELAVFYHDYQWPRAQTVDAGA